MSNEPLSSLVVDTGKVDTTRPQPKNGDWHCKVADLEVKPNKDNTGRNLIITFQAQAPIESMPSKVTGQSTTILNCKLSKHYPLQPPADKPDSDFYKVNLARLYDACHGTDDSTRPESLDISTCRGKDVFVTTKIESYQGADIASVDKVSFFRVN